ncbi:MAG TPA: hypothetical protein VE131_16700, partial [Terriglobales bacterium]|nr:hypothetical protein [Terriglobales bacterium]
GGGGLTGVSWGLGRKETEMISCGLIRFCGFGQNKMNSKWIAKEIAKKRVIGALRWRTIALQF